MQAPQDHQAINWRCHAPRCPHTFDEIRRPRPAAPEKFPQTSETPDVTRHLRPKVNASNRRHLIAVYNTQDPRCMDFKCGRQFPYVVEPNIDRSTLDAAHVGAVQPGTICSTLKRLRFILKKSAENSLASWHCLLGAAHLPMQQSCARSGSPQHACPPGEANCGCPTREYFAQNEKAHTGNLPIWASGFTKRPLHAPLCAR
jgi:hypothetical protein